MIHTPTCFLCCSLDFSFEPPKNIGSLNKHVPRTHPVWFQAGSSGLISSPLRTFDLGGTAFTEVAPSGREARTAFLVKERRPGQTCPSFAKGNRAGPFIPETMVDWVPVRQEETKRGVRLPPKNAGGEGFRLFLPLRPGRSRRRAEVWYGWVYVTVCVCLCSQMGWVFLVASFEHH